MWDNSGNFVRKKRRSLSQGLARKAPFHMVRIWGELRVSSSRLREAYSHPVRFIVNDLTVEGVSVFSSKSFAQGTQVGLFIPEPRPFYVSAEVLGCYLLNRRQGVLTEAPLTYRILLRFISYTTDEQADVRFFCNESINQFVRRANGTSI